MPKAITSIAMIEPCGDYGIGGYTYELCEGLVKNGIRVDVFTGSDYFFRNVDLPRHHRLLPALHSFTFRQRDLLRREGGTDANSLAPGGPVGAATEQRPSLRSRSALYSKVRNSLLPVDFAVHLKKSGYDLLWTQWLPPEPYGAELMSFCKLFGIRTVHTVHNVIPHEPMPGDVEKYEALYRKCDFLIVHSQTAKASFSALFPQTRAKVIVAPHGLYTMFPRMPETRKETRGRLGIDEGQSAILFFGCVRPYKNVDVVLEALLSRAMENDVLIVAGREACYDDLVLGDPLGRTRKMAEKMGISGRVRLLGGAFDLRQTAEIFEAADIVILPYTESYGSGQLLLGMSYGKFIVATRTGGMDEHMADYPRRVLIDGPDLDSVAKGIARCAELARQDAKPNGSVRVPALEWPNIAQRVLCEISA